MIRPLSIFVTALSLLSLSALAAESTEGTTTLESELNALQAPANQAPAGVAREKLYVVQSRYNPLKGRFGLSLGASRNLTGSSYLNMSQLNVDLRYHLSDRWSLNFGGSYGFNSFTGDANHLMANDGILPDAAYVKTRAHALAAFNLFYGKFRATMDEVFYFDQYIAAGPGLITTQYGSAPSGVLDIGFVFWAGKKFDVRVGLENEFYNEKRMMSSSFERHSLAHLDIGYTFGGAKTADTEIQ